MQPKRCRLACQGQVKQISCKAGGTNSSRFLAGMHSVDIAEIACDCELMVDQHHPFPGAQCSLSLSQGYSHWCNLQAEKRVFEVPFIFPTTGTGHVPCYPRCLVPNGKFVQCFMQPKRCRLACQGQVKQISCKAGGTNSSRFLAGMHSVDIAEIACDCELMVDQHHPFPGAQCSLSLSQGYSHWCNLQAEKRVFEVPFIFPTTGTGHVPCYSRCLVPYGKFVQCFMQPKRCRLACQGQVKQISCKAGGTNSSRFLAGMHSVDIAEIACDCELMVDQHHPFPGAQCSLSLSQGYSHWCNLQAEKCVFEVPFIFPTITGTGHVPCYSRCLVPNGKFVQCFMQPKRCRLACQGQVKQISCKAGGTNSSRFLAGMHSVDIAEIACDCELMVDQHHPFPGAQCSLSLSQGYSHWCNLQAEKRVFEVPFIFPTTGTGHVPCYPRNPSVVPGAKLQVCAVLHATQALSFSMSGSS